MLHGKDARFPVDKKTDVSGHTVAAVHRTMLWQICLDYRFGSDPRTLTVSEILFWYDGLRPTLRERTKRRG